MRFGRVGTGDTGATGDTGWVPAVSCRVLREQGDYDHIDYSYVDHPTYTIRTSTYSTGRDPIVYTFDPGGQELSYWDSIGWGYGGRFYDDAGRLIVKRNFHDPDYIDQLVERLEYDAGGHELSRLTVYNQNAWQNADRLYADTATYDAEGRQTGWGFDALADGVLEGVGTLTYGVDGLLVEQHDDWEPSTASDWNSSTTRWEYDERGYPARSEQEGRYWNGDWYCDYREYTYDDRGDLVIEDLVSCVGLGRTFLRVTSTYDDDHRKVEYVYDLIDPLHPGPDDEHWWWTYDEYGNLTSEVHQYSIVETTTWTWECR